MGLDQREPLEQWNGAKRGENGEDHAGQPGIP